MSKRGAGPVAPASPQPGELIGEGDLCRVVSRFVDALPRSAVDFPFGEVREKFRRDSGRPAFHPRMMPRVILHGCAQRLYSRRRVARAVERDEHFTWLAAAYNVQAGARDGFITGVGVGQNPTTTPPGSSRARGAAISRSAANKRYAGFIARAWSGARRRENTLAQGPFATRKRP